MMIACFLKKVHDQNQRKIGKNMVFWSCTFDIIYGIKQSSNLKLVIIEGKVSPMENKVKLIDS